MQTKYLTRSGEIEIDPYDRRGSFEKWVQSIKSPNGDIKYDAIDGVSKIGSELIIRHVLDMYAGKNIAKGSRKGPRGYNHLYNLKQKLHRVVGIIEADTKKPITEVSEDEVLAIFTQFREGIIKTKSGVPFISVHTYIKKFCAFWRWYMRISKQKGIAIMDIVDSVDTKPDHKPKWEYFAIKDVEKMAEVSSKIYYKALVYFLFDSGLRAPKELMNVRVKDITQVPDADNQLYLQIRDETSKTFGRKIKLMICCDFIKKHIEHYKLKPEDFLFWKSYINTTRMISLIGYRALGRGTCKKLELGKTRVSNGITMYDFRHNSVCYYLPLYKSENQIKYRYGWSNARMIQYYSEFIGMRDTISDQDMVTDNTRALLQVELSKEKQKVGMLQEQMNAQRTEFKERIKKLEQMMLQKFANSF